MISREQVIKGLECLTQRQEPTANPCKECGYINRLNFAICVKDVASDALELLKEQEEKSARVLTLDEAVDGNQVCYVEFRYHLDRGWVKCDFSRLYLDGEVAMLFLRNKTFYQQAEDYGDLWRLWNARPTYDQMKAVKWIDHYNDDGHDS